MTGGAGHGALASVFDKAAGRELLTRPGNDLVLQEEYQQHPRWNEGPWHLSPKGPGIAASSAEATVRAQRSPVGSRLVASYSLGGLSVTAETILWDGADRVEFRTHVSGSIGKDHLLRVRFPAALPGGAAGVPDGDGGHRAAVRGAGSGRGGALVDPRKPGQPLVRDRIGRAGMH